MTARIKVFNLNHPDLAVEKVRLAIGDLLIEMIEKARSSSLDLDDLSQVWELLGIDVVISLADIHGQHHTSKGKKISGRWDSNPRRSPWEGDILPLNYTRIRY
jgi:hypothetical protein